MMENNSNMSAKKYAPPVVIFCRFGEVEDWLLKFAVIAARYDNKWIFCRHKKRSTWEIPGGHREAYEDIEETAKRELYEETGAIDFSMTKICVYGVEREGVITYGALFLAEVKRISLIPETSEIGEICLSDALPLDLTYPVIQPHLYKKVCQWCKERFL